MPNERAERRSTRLSLEIPVTVTSLDPAHPFQETCHTVVVNGHGCGVVARQSLESGTPITVELQDKDRRMGGRVVMSISVGGGTRSWILGIQFDEPGNFGGIENPPQD